MNSLIRFCAVVGTTAFCLTQWVNAAVYDVDEAFTSSALCKASAAARSQKVEQIFGELKAGDELYLSRRYPTGEIDASNLPDGVTIRWGHEGRLVLGNRTYEGLHIENSDVVLQGAPGLGKTGVSANGTTIRNSYFVNTPAVSNMNMDNVKSVEQWPGEKTWNVTGSWKNCSVLYLWYHTKRANDFPLVHFKDVDATNSKIYGIVEVNYCYGVTSVVFDNVTGLTYGNGDTERHNAPAGVYKFYECKDFTLVNHRNFSSKGIACVPFRGNGYVISGSDNIQFMGVVDIGASTAFSCQVMNSPNFKIWGGFFEADVNFIGDTSSVLKMFFTPDGFGDAEAKQWVSPAIVDEEVILDYNGVVIDTATQTPPDLSEFTMPKPPLIPPLELLGDQIGNAKVRAPQAPGASWGGAVVAAGADPTGKTSSAAAIQTVLDGSNFVELPAGDLLFDQPVRIPVREGTRTVRIAGAGKHRTRVRTTGSFPSFVYEDTHEYLRKTGASFADLATVELSDIAFDGGGTKEYEMFHSSHSSTRHSNLTFENYTKAAVIIGSASKIDDLSYKIVGDGYDQVRWHNCDFINTGDYGLFSNRDQCDKQLYYRCLFQGQEKAGLAIVRSHMFEASSIVNCTFKDINGPGVKLGYNDVPNIGTPPGPTMVMNCVFEECGNATEAALEFSYTRQSTIVNNRISIQNKPWKYGYAGTASCMQNNVVDVNPDYAEPGALAYAIRHPRLAGNNRLTGNIMSNNTSTWGKLGFINDVAEFEATYGDNLAMPVGRCEYPFAYTHLIADCEFDGGSQVYDYALVRTDKQGQILTTMNINGETGVSYRQPQRLNAVGSDAKLPVFLYSAAGKKVMRLESTAVSSADLRGRVGNGVYFVRKAGAAPKRVVVSR